MNACTPTQQSWQAVQFDYGAWIKAYPEFSGTVSNPQAQEFWDLATLENQDCAVPASGEFKQRKLLNLLTAHIASLFKRIQDGGNGLVGRISDATEGTVSVSAQAEYPPGTAQWFQQTQYGALYWQLTSYRRTMRYIPGPGAMFNAAVRASPFTRGMGPAWLYSSSATIY